MRLIPKLLSALALCAVAAAQQSSNVSMSAPTPPTAEPTSVTLSGTGTAGTTACYWIVAHYPSGTVLSATNQCSRTAPASPNGTNYLTVAWTLQTGATSYDVIRYAFPSLPAALTCTSCVIATAQAGPNYADQGGSTTNFTGATAIPAAGYIAINNRDNANPVMTATVQSGAYSSTSTVLGLPFGSSVNGTTLTLPGTLSIGGTVSAKNYVDVTQFGADPTGATNSNAAFIAARNYLYAAGPSDPTGNAAYLGNSTLHIPAGKYLITTPQALISSTAPAWVNGWNIEGDGESTQIDYEPVTTSWTVAGATLTSIVISGTTGTITTSTATGLAVGSCVTVYGGATPLLNNTYLIASGGGASTSFTVTVNNVTAATYNDSGLSLSTSCPMLFNNTIQGLRIHDITFYGTDLYSDWMYSNSGNGTGPKDFKFENVSWYGSWNRLFNMDGPSNATANNNDHLQCERCQFFTQNSNRINYVLWTNGKQQTQFEQFIEYWFDHCIIALGHGNFARMNAGGHLSVTNNDFPGLGGSGNSAAPDVMYYLAGGNHYAGVTHMQAYNNRYELLNNSVKVLFDQWGGTGQVTFDHEDYSSKVYTYPNATTAFEIDFTDSGSGDSGFGAYFSVSNSSLIGQVLIDGGLFDYNLRRLLSFTNVEFLGTDDWSTNVIFNSSPSCAGCSGTYPYASCTNCRGNGVVYTGTNTAWAATTAYAVNAQVTANNYIYKCTVAGTSGTVAPYGRSTALVDGTVTWATQDLFNPSNYAASGSIHPIAMYMPTNGTGSENVASLNVPNNYGLLPVRASSTVNAYSRVVVPQSAMVARVTVAIAANGSNQSAAATYNVRSDEYSPTTFGVCTISAPQSGGVCEYLVAFPVGTDYGKRSVIVEATTNVTTANIGWAVVRYY